MLARMGIHRRRVKHSDTLEERLAAEAKALREQDAAWCRT
jgi:hypothetical protein